MAKSIENDFSSDIFSSRRSTPLNDHQNTESYESLCRRKDGNAFIAQVSIIPLPQDDQKVVVIQDISAQKKLQQKASQTDKRAVDIQYLCEDSDQTHTYRHDDAGDSRYARRYYGGRTILDIPHR